MSASASGEWLARHRPQAWGSWPQALPPARHRARPRSSHPPTMARQGGAHPMAGVVQRLPWATSRPDPKISSTGWGRYIYRPPPQMGSPWPTLRFMHKICRKIRNEALRYPYRLTQRPNLPIILKDSPKSGQKWLKPINLPRAIQPAGARVAQKARRISPR